jgi:hypothetical protein
LQLSRLRPGYHHHIKNSALVPAAQPAHAPAIDAIAERDGFSQAKEFCLHFRSFLHAATSMALCRASVKANAQIGHRQPFAFSDFVVDSAIFALRFRATRGMNRHAPDLAQKGFTGNHHDERRSHYH